FAKPSNMSIVTDCDDYKQNSGENIEEIPDEFDF
ncbi:MAG: hypothetical protein ACI9KI_001931, partial [Patiriisocius sp.]